MEDITIRSPEGYAIEGAIDKAEKVIEFYKKQGYKVISMSFNQTTDIGAMSFDITFRREEK